MMRNITEFDIIFLSYDEHNAERNWSDLLEKAPWSKRVHGVKGFDAAHRECARQSETDWFITVDADNIVRPDFFDLTIQLDDDAVCLSWNGLNAINGLSYGNGGLKLWKKEYALELKTHELSDDKQAVDFCWEHGYKNMRETYSDVWNNSTPYQAFRVGFREGVKLSLDRGKRISAEMMRHLLHPINLRNLRIWCCVGAHIENGEWAMFGARSAWQMMCDPSWDHTVVRDYDWFDEQWISHKRNEYCLPEASRVIARDIQAQTKIELPLLGEGESAFFRDIMIHRNE